MINFKKWSLFIGITASLSLCTNTFAQDTAFEILEAEASSVLPESAYGTYTPWNLNDNDLSTAWVENVSGNGEGESVTFLLPAGAVVTGVYIVNGYCKSESLFYTNGAPSALTCRASGKKCTLDLGDTANDYNKASKGCILDFPAPIEASTITFEIKDVRSGSAYQNTCISELHVLGYNFFDADWEEYKDPDALGYEELMDVPEDMTEQEVYNLQSMLNNIYRMYCKGNFIDDFALESDYASPELKAFLLYWYQYHFSEDSRINSGDEYHEISKSDLDEMLDELWGTHTEEDFEAFREYYVTEIDSDRYSTYAAGDFGDAGHVIFRNPHAYYEDDFLVLRGDIAVYDSSSNAYIPSTQYFAKFEKEKANDQGIHTFLSMEIDAIGSEPGAPMDQEPIELTNP